jgi:hypothetical protein
MNYSIFKLIFEVFYHVDVSKQGCMSLTANLKEQNALWGKFARQNGAKASELLTIVA